MDLHELRKFSAATLRVAAVIFASYVIAQGIGSVARGRSFVQGMLESLDNSWVAWIAIATIVLGIAIYITHMSLREKKRENNKD